MTNKAIWIKIWIISSLIQLLSVYIVWEYARLDILLVILIFWSVKFGYFKGTIAGFLVGLLEDCLSVMNLGVHACSKALVGAIIGSFPKFLYCNNAIFFFFATCIFTVIDKNIAFLLYSHTLAFSKETLYQLLLHGLLSLILYRVFLRNLIIDIDKQLFKCV